MKAISCAVLMLVAHGTSARAQSTPRQPDDVVRQFFKAENEGQWLDAARLLDLGRFEVIRQTAVKNARMPRKPPQLTTDDMMRMDPDMPRAVAEYQVKQTNKAFTDFDFFSREWARVASADSLAALPIDEAAARWLEARGPKWQEELALRSLKRHPTSIKCPVSPDSIPVEAMTVSKSPVVEILGTAGASDSVQYVVVGQIFPSASGRLMRSDLAALRMEMSPTVLKVVRIDGNWRIVPAADMVDGAGERNGSVFMVTCENAPAKPTGRRK